MVFTIAAMTYVLIVFSVAFISTSAGKKITMKAVDRRLYSAAASLPFLLADDFHDRALKADSIGDEEERRNRTRMEAFAKTSGMRWIYTLVRSGGAFYFTSPTACEAEECERRYFLHYPDAPGAFHRALETGEPVFVDYEDSSARFRSVAVPLKSPGGRSYLACADLQIEDLAAMGRGQVLHSLIATIGLLLGLLPILLLYRWETEAHSRSLSYMNERLKDAAQASEERFRRLFEHSADAVAVLNAWELVEYVNPAFTSLFGWPRDELVGRKLPIVPAHEQEEADALVEALRDRAEAYRDLETRRVKKNGSALDVVISGAPLSDGRGGFAGSLLLIRDRTARRKLEAQVIQAEKLRAVSALAAGAAHDFNNALMLIQGNLSLLTLECELCGRGKEIVKGIENALRSAATMTRELLDFAHPEETAPEPTDIEAVTRRAIGSYFGPHPTLTVETEFDEKPLLAFAKAEGLERALVNLFVNAGHAMSNSGTVCVSVTRTSLGAASAAALAVSEGAYIALRVSDSGCGMSEEVRKHLFEPLFTTKKHGVGTGLGLATVYAAIRSFGGAIEVESEPGKGSTFSLYLPVAPS